MLLSPYPMPNTVRRKVTTRLLLARHGETDWNRLGRWQGQADPPLNDSGRRQALALGASLKTSVLAAVYSSTLKRASETAQVVAAQHRLNVCRDPRLNEIDLGDWEGLTRKEISVRYADLLRAWEADPCSVRPPHGETIADLEERVLAVMREIARAYPGETVCVVGHKISNGVIRSRYLGLPLIEALRSAPEHIVVDTMDIPHPLWG